MNLVIKQYDQLNKRQDDEESFLRELIEHSFEKAEHMATHQHNHTSYVEHLIEFDSLMIEDYYGKYLHKGIIFQKIEQYELTFLVFEKMLSNVVEETKLNVFKLLGHRYQLPVTINFYKDLYEAVTEDIKTIIKKILNTKCSIKTINLYPENFVHDDFLSTIESISDNKRKKVAIEIIEKDIPESKEQIFIENVYAAQQLGYKIAIDDINPGKEGNYSMKLLSTLYKNNIKVDFVKIDGPYFKEIITQEKYQELEDLIFYIVTQYKIKTFVIEHIENQELYIQAQKLEKSFHFLDFHYQGYLFIYPQEKKD